MYQMFKHILPMNKTNWDRQILKSSRVFHFSKIVLLMLYIKLVNPPNGYYDGEQCRPRCNTASSGISSGSALFAKKKLIFREVLKLEF